VESAAPTEKAEVSPRRVTQRAARSQRLGALELRRLVDRAPDVLFRYRIDPPAFELVSSAVTRVTGFTPDELYADPASALDHVHPDDRPLVDGLPERGTGHTPTVLRLLRKDGSVVWIEQRTTAVRDGSGRIVAIEGIVREIPDPTVAPRSHVRVLGDVRIDLDRGRVVVEGRDVRLTPSELRLLVLLTDRPGTVVSRATIVEEVWNGRYTGCGRRCEVHISKLRAKIERDPRRPRLIETVRGVGYRFAASGCCGGLVRGAGGPGEEPADDLGDEGRAGVVDGVRLARNGDEPAPR
jgi:PAS domain S-box-containing protein